MLTIYGSPKSSAGRCFWCLEEVEVEYQTKSISFQDKEHKSDEFLKVNPNGKVPAVVDGEFTIWESMAINFYLAEKYKPELLGDGPELRGLNYQWSFWSIADLQPPMIQIFIQQYFVPEDRRDNALIESSMKKLPSLFQTLNLSLNDKDYLTGSDFSLADLNCASVVALAQEIGYDSSTFENIEKWIARIQTRPSFVKFRNLCN